MLVRAAIIAVFTLAVSAGAWAQSYGLSSRPAFTAFNNNVFPPNASSISGSWSAVPVWPGLTFSNPLGILQEPGTQRMIVWEREGHVYAFDKATGASKRLILDISAHTQGWDDCGLLNMVCHPDYANNHFVFIYYCWVDGVTHQIQGSSNARVPTEHVVNWKRLARFTMRPDGTLDPASETVLWHQKCASLWHSGSGMFFHPDDGFLYFINGDDFDPAKAQKLDGGLFSGIFRIDVDQRGGSISHANPRTSVIDNAGSYTANYFIPNDNPLVGQSGVAEEYIALGVRSPHRLTLDPVSKRMFHSDVGDASREEINVFEPGEVMPNYQWPKFEGLIGKMTAPYIGLDKPPILDYTHADGQAVIGGYVYRGTEFPELQGKYIFGDNMVGLIWYLDESTVPATKVPICKLSNGAGKYTGDNYLGLSSFGVDANNELYLVRMSFTDGTIMKLSRTGGNANTPPASLSQTQVFSDLATLTANTGFIAYEVNTPLWSDGAEKHRWFAVPSGQRIGYAPTGEWSFPTGSVFVKHFELNTDETQPTQRRRLETRVMVRDNQGYVYGATYKWRADNSDADLINDSQTEDITITTASGTRTQSWLYPGRQTCLSCHTTASKGVLGLNTPQIHRDHVFDAITDNQLRAWSHVGYFTPAIAEASLPSLQAFASLANTSASIELRARSYLDANCSHCHRPGGTSHAMWDARIETPLDKAGIVDGAVFNELGVTGTRVIKPGATALSVLHTRINSATDSYAMPPLAKARIDTQAVAAIDQWIASLPASPPPQPSIPASFALFGGAWSVGGVLVEGDRYSLTHGTNPRGDLPGPPYPPQPETPAVWMGMPVTTDGCLMVHVRDDGPPRASDMQCGLMARTSLTDGASGQGLIDPLESFHDYGFTPTYSWLMLGYSGNNLIQAVSTDGINWKKATTAQARPSKLYLGMWFSSINVVTSLVAQTVTFDHVRFFPTAPWAITTQPTSQLVRVGDLVEFGIETIGLPPTSYQWRKNNVSISRAVSDRYAFKAALSSAGSYNVLTGGKLLSNNANLVVLDKVTYTTNLAPKATATFTLTYAGTGASIVWTKDGVPLQNDGRITGATTGKLSIAKLTLADIGDYECVVGGFGSTQVLGPFPLHVLSKPTITASAPPDWSVSRAFTWQLTTDEPATSYVVKGLPSGLVFNAKTGLVTGTPNVGGSFDIDVYASNAAGTGVVRRYTLKIEAFPLPLVGSFSGLVARDTGNGQIGGTLALAITSTGTTSGRLVYGSLAYPLTGRATFVSGTDPTLSLTFKRTGNSDLVLALNLRSTGSIDGNANGASITARRVVSSAGATAGTYYASLDPVTPGDLAQPQGSGWARLIMTAAGSVTIAGRMADNSVLTASCSLRDDGSIAWHQALYGNKGSVRGTPSFAAGAITGALDWQKLGPASTKDRTYASGFALMNLTVDGLKPALPPVHQTYLGNADTAGNARIEFTQAHITDAAQQAMIDQTFHLTETHKAIFDGSATNPCAVTLTITPTTGYFSGTFKLKDGAVPRSVTYQGVMLPGRTAAHGAFTLLQLPGTATSPIQSGALLLKAVP